MVEVGVGACSFYSFMCIMPRIRLILINQFERWLLHPVTKICPKSASQKPNTHTYTHTRTPRLFLQIQVLPPGASKGAGVAALLKALDIDPAHVLAIGDAENDVEVCEKGCFSLFGV